MPNNYLLASQRYSTKVRKIIQKIPHFVWVVGTCLAFLAAGTQIGRLWEQNSTVDASHEVRSQDRTKHTHPLLECDLPPLDHVSDFSNLKSDLKETISSEMVSGNISFASVYYKDLNTRQWLGINETDLFAPASLVKIPIMMALLKEAESKPDLLETRVVAGTYDYQGVQNIMPESMLVANQTYTVKELMERMLIYSDNYAYEILFSMLDEKTIIHIYKEIGINIEEVNRTSPYSNFMTVREYALLFKILYNASYLNEESSEYALALLTKSQFKKGLVAKLPNLEVAHKFGERINLDNGESQLHDCGIVYHPDNPYILCVMTKGTDIFKQSAVIATLSEQVFKNLEVFESE